MPLQYPVYGPSVLPPESVPSTIDLLGLPYVFTQGPPLTVRGFISEAKDRGLRLDRGELEQLHRRGVLVPFYRVHPRPMREGRDLRPKQQNRWEAWQLYEAAREGRLSDPSVRPFRQWPGPRSEASIYYSRYQLLGLRSLRLVLTGMRRRRGQDDAIAWELDPLRANHRNAHEQNRALAAVLEILSPRYRPRVMGRVRSPDEGLWEMIDDHDPRTETKALELSDELLLRQAEGLLSQAKTFDPLGKWHRVTRIANRHRWNELRNDALLAQEYRLAAEMILQFLEDQARHGRAKPLKPLSTSWHEPRHDRLTVDQRERAETIMDFTLSDRPAVYLAMEGQTEVAILNKVLDLAGVESPSHWLSVIDRQGVGGDVNLLARAIAVPRLDPEGHRGARILSSLSALIVVSDPEERYQTDESRDEVLAGMKEHVLKSLPPSLRTTEMEQDLGHLLHVHVWEAEFEFAHFSDSELARGLKSAVGRGVAPPEKELRRDLAKCRRAPSTIRNVWTSWRQTPSKVALAEALWPALESRILNPRSQKPIPILELVEVAFRVANDVRGAREMAVR